DRAILERSLELSSQELLAANSKLRAIYERLIESSPDGIFAFDRECRYTVWNPAMEGIFGRSPLQTLGKCAFDVFPSLKETGEDQGVAGLVWQTGQPLVIDNYQGLPGLGLDVLRAWAAMPLLKGSQVTGVIGVARTEENLPFSEDEVAPLKQFAQLASIALDN